MPKELIDMSDKEIWEQLGWANKAFYETRFEIIEQKLSPEKLEKWNTFPTLKKVATAQRLIEKGILI